MVRCAASDLFSETLRGVSRDPRRENDLGHLDRDRWSRRTQEVAVDVPADDAEDPSVPRHLALTPFVHLFESFEPGGLQTIFVLEVVDRDRDRPVAGYREGKRLANDDQGPVIEPISSKVSFGHRIPPCDMFGVLVNHLAKARCKFILNDAL